jgi:hypothetical protein
MQRGNGLCIGVKEYIQRRVRGSEVHMSTGTMMHNSFRSRLES